MKVLIYSPSDDEKEVYLKGEKHYKELGYEVFNPYDHKLESETLKTTIYRLLLVVNMVVCVSKLERRFGRVSRDVVDVKDFCYKNGILFRIYEKDRDLHYTKWGRKKLKQQE